MCVTKSRLALGRGEYWLVDTVAWEISTNQKAKNEQNQGNDDIFLPTAWFLLLA